MKLLIVEDEWIAAHFIADVALEENFEIAGIAQNYEETFEIINQTSIDCVILDINIKGGKSGIDVARTLKIKQIPFIFLTAYKDIETIKEATELAPLAYLIKPVCEEDIIATLLIIKNQQKPMKKFPFEVNNQGMILKDNEIIILSEFERMVFSTLIKNYKNTVPREVLFNLLWENLDEINEGTLRNIILKLRKKFNLTIHNVKNIGYCLV